jgi:23S rRNA (adenine2030-N6)-methyltransferase
MNYRHEFHAGNFADVLKHAVLTRILLYLQRKDKPFRYLDTHAGAGLYDLSGPEAARSGEARDGIAILRAQPPTGEAGELLAPYLAAVAACAPLYPGSPKIAQAFLRRQDKAICCELLPQAFASLRQSLGRDSRVKAVELDGYLALNAFLPPPERRGLVLIDPPFERRDEYERIFDGVSAALRKWAGGIFVIWQPVKEPALVDSFCRALAPLGEGLRIELQVETPAPGRPLARTGLIVLNPPFVLEEEARTLLPVLAEKLARGPGAGFRIERLQSST